MNLLKSTLPATCRTRTEAGTAPGSGNPDRTFHQDISHQELEALVRQIRTGRGLVFDTRA